MPSAALNGCGVATGRLCSPEVPEIGTTKPLPGIRSPGRYQRSSAPSGVGRAATPVLVLGEGALVLPVSARLRLRGVSRVRLRMVRVGRIGSFGILLGAGACDCSPAPVPQNLTLVLTLKSMLGMTGRLTLAD